MNSPFILPFPPRLPRREYSLTTNARNPSWAAWCPNKMLISFVLRASYVRHSLGPPSFGLRLGRNEKHSMPVLILCLLFCFISLYPTPVLNKGQCVTKYYRWMQKNGGYIWIQSSATIAINAKNANEKNVIWVNYLLRYLFCYVSLAVINCTHCG